MPAAQRTRPARTTTIPEAARQWGVSDRTIRRRIADGTLTGYRLGGRLIRLDADEVEALFDVIPTAGDAA